MDRRNVGLENGALTMRTIWLVAVLLIGIPADAQETAAPVFRTDADAVTFDFSAIRKGLFGRKPWTGLTAQATW